MDEIKKYRLNFTETLKLETFIDVEIPKSMLNDFMENKGLLEDLYERAYSTEKFIELLMSEGIKVLDSCDELDNVEIYDFEFDDFDKLED